MTEYTYPEFEKPYYCNRDINFKNPPRIPFAAADTETRQYVDDKRLNDDDGYELMKMRGTRYCKTHIVVRVWAYMLFFEYSDAGYFLVFQTIEDFMKACAMLRIGSVIWYNAKFDFSFFDYYVLSHGWKPADTVVSSRRFWGKLPAGCYNSLHNDRGQRYKYDLWISYKNKNNKDKTHRLAMLDLANVLPGGLAGNLKSWDVQDPAGNPIRKLTMDYVNDDIATAYDYMYNDTAGLYYLTVKFTEEMDALTGFNYLHGDFMTSGGLAKKTMISRMYRKDYKPALKMFHRDFPMTQARDDMLRRAHLYSGGKTLVNPRYCGKVVSGIYKLDVNSMYPYIMHDMLLPYGAPEMTDVYEHKDGYVQIIHMHAMCGRVKPGMIGMWYDLDGREYTDVIDEQFPFFIFADEFEELLHWYDLTAVIDFVWTYKGVQNIGLRSLIDEFYDIKANSTGAKKLCVKIVLNAMYGKLAEKPIKGTAHYELSRGGYIHLIPDLPETDSKSILNVIIGAEVTSLARVHLMRKIREVTDGNPVENFVYCDTDSIHALTRNTDTDAKTLGALKIESEDGQYYDKGLYLAPKTYIMVHRNYYDPDKRTNESLVVHCKGVNVDTMKRMLLKCMTIEEMKEIFKANNPVKCLSALNVIGGKALIFNDKFILRSNICDGQENMDLYDEKITEVLD